MLFIQSSLHGSHGSINEGEKPTYIIAIIDASNRMITISKDIDCRLDPDEPIKLIKDGQSDPLIRIQLA
jgi:hypothetical protein